MCAIPIESDTALSVNDYIMQAKYNPQQWQSVISTDFTYIQREVKSYFSCSFILIAAGDSGK